jgi:hypothetical protein
LAWTYPKNKNKQDRNKIKWQHLCFVVVVIVLATGPKVRGFDPGRWRWIFKGDKNP